MPISFNIITPDDQAWRSAFERLPASERDVFYDPRFAAVCQETLNRSDEVLCAVATSGDGVLLYPFIKRDLGRLTGVAALADKHDMTGLYGRGGIVASAGGLQHLGEFHAALAAYCRESRITCGFDRYHPVLENHLRTPLALTSVMDISGFVVVDMRPEVPDIVRAYKQSVRKDIRKAERNGIRCFAEQSTRHLADFLRIYYATMVRNAAADFYYFPESYFRRLEQVLADSFTFFYAEAGGEIVSCELALHHGLYCHSFLGGTMREALPLCPNPLLKHAMILHFRQMGCEHFLLGGGTTKDDGIFSYKRAFAPNGVLPSHVGGTIWDAAAYGSLRAELLRNGAPIAENRFQFYDVH